MSKNQENDSYPKAIYFDTNVLASMPYWNINKDFAELGQIVSEFNIGLFSPELVIMELIQRRTFRALNEIKKIDEGCQKIGHLLKREPLKRENVVNIKETIDLFIREYISEIGIISIPTPTDILLDELIDMSVWKEPPFEKEHWGRSTVLQF